MIYIDGENFDDCARITSLVEKFDILNGKNSGRTQAGTMYIEVVGTYFNYTVTFKRKNAGTLERWDRLKHVLANPKTAHTITIYHDQGVLTDYHVYVSSGQRELLHTKQVGDQFENEWGDLSVDFVAMDKMNPREWGL